jgi:hypothetical protein
LGKLLGVNVVGLYLIPLPNLPKLFQEFAMHEKAKEDKNAEMAGTDDETGGDPAARSEQQAQKDGGKDDKDKNKKKGQQKKKLEPSLKWKALGMEESQELIFFFVHFCASIVVKHDNTFVYIYKVEWSLVGEKHATLLT